MMKWVSKHIRRHKKSFHLQESFGVMVCLRLVQSAQQDGSNLREIHIIAQSVNHRAYNGNEIVLQILRQYTCRRNMMIRKIP